MEWRKLKIALFITIYMLLFVWLAFLIQLQFDDRLQELGILPRKWYSIGNFVISPLLHGSITHLVNNTIAFFVLLLVGFYFYGGVILRVVVGGVASGILVWIFGRESYHIGLSGVCYTLASFLFISGIVRRNVSLMAISLLVAFWESGMIWGMVPSLNEPLNISWEGHLFGAVVGFGLAIVFRHHGPPNDPVPEDLEDDDSFAENFSAEEAEEDEAKNKLTP